MLLLFPVVILYIFRRYPVYILFLDRYRIYTAYLEDFYKIKLFYHLMQLIPAVTHPDMVRPGTWAAPAHHLLNHIAMAKLDSVFGFTGSLGRISAYKMKGSDETILRRKGGPSWCSVWWRKFLGNKINIIQIFINRQD